MVCKSASRVSAQSDGPDPTLNKIARAVGVLEYRATILQTAAGSPPTAAGPQLLFLALRDQALYFERFRKRGGGSGWVSQEAAYSL